MRILVLALALWGLACPARAGNALEGRWVLTEQTYQGGGRNLAPVEAPVRLEFSTTGEVVTGRIWAGESSDAALPWPAIVVEGRPLPLTVLSVGRTLTGGVSARYMAVPVEGDDVVLEIRETYETAESGRVLAGSVEVRFMGESMNRGGFTLHRRFEREE